MPGTLAAEFAIFAIGLVLYLRETTPRDRIGSIGLWSLVGFLVVVYLASTFGPPPPTAAARRLVRAGDVAARGLGLLDRQAPGASSEWG